MLPIDISFGYQFNTTFSLTGFSIVAVHCVPLPWLLLWIKKMAAPSGTTTSFVWYPSSLLVYQPRCMGTFIWGTLQREVSVDHKVQITSGHTVALSVAIAKMSEMTLGSAAQGGGGSCDRVWENGILNSCSEFVSSGDSDACIVLFFCLQTWLISIYRPKLAYPTCLTWQGGVCMGHEV